VEAAPFTDTIENAMTTMAGMRNFPMIDFIGGYFFMFAVDPDTIRRSYPG